MEGGWLVKIGAHPGTGIIHFHTPILLFFLAKFDTGTKKNLSQLQNLTQVLPAENPIGKGLKWIGLLVARCR